MAAAALLWGMAVRMVIVQGSGCRVWGVGWGTHIAERARLREVGVPRLREADVGEVLGHGHCAPRPEVDLKEGVCV